MKPKLLGPLEKSDLNPRKTTVAITKDQLPMKLIFWPQNINITILA